MIECGFQEKKWNEVCIKANENERVKENIDATINALCDNIQEELKKGPIYESFPEKIRALTELIYARNFEHHQTFRLDKERLIQSVMEKIALRKKLS